MADRVDELIQQLTSSSWEKRRDACMELGKLGDVRAFEPLIQRLGDDYSSVRAAACEALGKLGFGAEAQLVTQAVAGKAQAVEQLRARIAAGEERLLRPLLKALEDESTDLAAVSRLLGALGDVRVLELLIQRLQEEAPDPDVEMLTLEALAAACEALGALGDVRVVDPLITVLQEISDLCCNILDLDLDDPERYDEVATAVCEALGAFGGHPRVVEALREIASDGNEVARAAIRVLAKLGVTDEVEFYTMVLRTHLPDIDELFVYERGAFEICSKACAVLGASGDVRAVEPLLQVVRTLGDSGPYWDETGENLYYMVLYEACEALGNLGDVRAVNPLIELLNYDDYEVASAACDAVIKLGDVRAVEPLIQRLADKSRQVRMLACQALGELGDARAANAIIQLTLQEKDPEVLQAAQEALKRLLPAQGETAA